MQKPSFKREPTHHSSEPGIGLSQSVPVWGRTVLVEMIKGRLSGTVVSAISVESGPLGRLIMEKVRKYRPMSMFPS